MPDDVRKALPKTVGELYASIFDLIQDRYEASRLMIYITNLSGTSIGADAPLSRSILSCMISHFADKGVLFHVHTASDMFPLSVQATSAAPYKNARALLQALLAAADC